VTTQQNSSADRGPIDPVIVDQAIDWHMRQPAMTNDDWQDFILWLEAEPAHAAAFDRVALDACYVTQRPDLLPPPAKLTLNRVAPGQLTPARPARPRWLWVAGGGGALAASVALALLVAPAIRGGDGFTTITTRPGERRDLTLDDGTRIEISGGSRLRLEDGNSRLALLDAGEATFHVRHDAGNPFTVRSGGLTLEDKGTVFNVLRSGPQLDVQVAEGSVLYEPGRKAMLLTAGTALAVREDVRRLTLTRVAVESIGGWRQGRLSFAGQPLERLAEAVHRLYGITMVLDPGLSARPFTGMVSFSGIATKDIPHIASLVGAKWRHDGEHWFLTRPELAMPPVTGTGAADNGNSASPRRHN
jgi:transmembrane sensor